MVEPQMDARFELLTEALRIFEEKERFPWREEVRLYFLREALAPAQEYEETLRAGKFDPATVRDMIVEALSAGKAIALERGLEFLDLEAARQGALRIIELKFRCPWPFLIC